jgi:hypothetical protein
MRELLVSLFVMSAFVLGVLGAYEYQRMQHPEAGRAVLMVAAIFVALTVVAWTAVR